MTMTRRIPALAVAALLPVLAAGCASQGGPEPAAAGEADRPAVVITHEPDSSAPTAGSTGEPSVDEVPLEPVEMPTEPAPAPETEESEAPEETLARSLEQYELAQRAWERGELEEALGRLDLAYSLMVGAGVEDDPILGQQREDLRRLIAQRVLEVYASTRTAAGDLSDEIPRTMNGHVEREIRSFQGPEREAFLEGYRRSGLYRQSIVEVLREQGMPEQLSWLPMVESWFKVRALSRARALGMWQFIASTGYRFGLQRTDWYDERMDPEKSTRAAAAYLTELHEMFGDWMTALAAYNSGEARVLRLIRQQRLAYFDQFWDLYELLPGETRRYVPRFLATLAIVEDPAKYGFDDLPEPYPPVDTRAVPLDRSVPLDALEKELGFAKGSLAELNPELRRGVTPPDRYELRVPASAGAEAVLASIESLPEAPRIETTTYRVRSGDTLSGIASRYRTSVRSLMALNGLSNAHRLAVGQLLRVSGTAAPAASGAPFTYTVRRGDSLWRIANRYGTTVDRLKADNGLRSSRLQPGQQLRVSGSGGGATYVVQRGDTLGRIAQRQGVSVRRLAEANGLSLRSTIYPGQRLLIPRG